MFFSGVNSMKFIRDQPAMQIKDALVISDIHIGITRDLWERGVSVPTQVSNLAGRVNALKKLTKTKRLVVLGDVKHKVPGTALQELKEVPEFFNSLKYKSITVVKGNHDGHIERMLPKNIRVVHSMELGNCLLTHGHRNVETGKSFIVMGHNQPHVRFRDDMKAVYSEPVWVMGRLAGNYEGKRLVIVPAFNELCGATLVNKDELLGPIAKHLMKTAHCYLLDGTDLGAIKDLRSIYTCRV